MKKIIIVFALALLSIFAYSQDKSEIKIYGDKNLSTITYSMNHPMHSWTGESKDVTSIIVTNENKSIIKQVAVSVKIASFDSKNANRDSHTMEVTEALKYPNVTFTSTSIIQNGDKLSVVGTLNFHGIKQTIKFEAEKKIVNNKIEVTGNFIAKMSQFNIKPPSLMLMATDDDIKISFKAEY